MSSGFVRYLTNIIATAVLTLCACTPPLDQVLQLWDFLLAFGVHLNVLCVIAQLLLMRDEVMSSSRCVILVAFFVINLKPEHYFTAQCAFSEHFLLLKRCLS